jgi:hypothetical protein
MPESQWLYWLVAIPFTMIVIGISLHMAGELSTLLNWTSSVFGRFARNRTRRPAADGAGYGAGSGYPEPRPFFPTASTTNSRPFAQESRKHRFSLRPMGAVEMLRRGMAKDVAQQPAELNA